MNFWRPSPDSTFKGLQPGELLLFKLSRSRQLHRWRRFIHPVSPASGEPRMDTVREAKGVWTLAEMRERIAHHRRSPIAPNKKPTIGCIMPGEPFRCTKEQTLLPEKKEVINSRDARTSRYAETD